MSKLVGRVGAEGVTRHLGDPERRIMIRPTSCPVDKHVGNVRSKGAEFVMSI
jgi:hypothetical protein